MPTVVLNLWSIAYPTIVNDIRIDVATQANPLAVVSSQTDSTAGHPARIWSFPGLPRENYQVRMNEIDADGNPITQLAFFDVVPDNIDGVLVRDDEQIFPDITPGFASGVTQVFFDGREVGTTGGVTSTLETNTLVDTGGSNRITFKGTVVEGDQVIVDYSYTDPFGEEIHEEAVTHGQAGWTYEDIAADLLTTMIGQAGSSTVSPFTDIDGFPGIEVSGFPGAHSMTCDITNATSEGETLFAPDYRGWNINPERRNQPGTMIRDQEYSWNEDTGEFNLLVEGDIFLPNEPYNIDFDPIADPTGGSVPVVLPQFGVRILTATGDALLSDFGNKVIFSPTADYMEFNLPDIVTVTENLPILLEVRKDTDCCVKIVPNGTDVIGYTPKLFMCRMETLRIYKLIYSDGGFEWRVDQADGNFKTAGTEISSDIQASRAINMLPVLGGEVDYQQYARLYDFVLSLPAGQAVPYADWSTLANKAKFSLKNDSTGKFRLPYRMNLYSRVANVAIEVVGTFYRMSLENHKHISTNGAGTGTPAPYGGSGSPYNKIGWQDHDNDNQYWFTNDGLEIGGNQMNPAGVVTGETRPNSYSINKYILI